MSYEITFNQFRKAHLEWSPKERQSSLSKKDKVVKDVIFIKATGRNIHSRIFRGNVSYCIYDYNVPVQVRGKIYVVIVYPHIAKCITDVIIQIPRRSTFKLSRPVQEFYDAIIEADKEYSKVGGGVLYSKALHTSNEARKMLFEALSALKTIR